MNKRLTEMEMVKSAVGKALRRGQLVRSLKCAITGEVSARLQCCHRDYRKPLDVVWATPRAHRRLDYFLNRSRYNHTNNPASKAIFKKHMKLAGESLKFEKKPITVSFKEAIKRYKGGQLAAFKKKIVAEIDKYGIPAVSKRYCKKNKYHIWYELIIMYHQVKMRISDKQSYRSIIKLFEVSVRREISAVAEDIGITKACAVFSIDRTTLYKWRQTNFKRCNSLREEKRRKERTLV